MGFALGTEPPRDRTGTQTQISRIQLQSPHLGPYSPHLSPLSLHNGGAPSEPVVSPQPTGAVLV